MNPYQKPFVQMMAEREKSASRERALAGMVGVEFLFHGPADADRTSARLYPERIGRRCTVLSVTDARVQAPLLIVFGDGFRGIAEPGWLVADEKSRVANG